VLPDYFPSLTRECQKAGLVFFHCFSEQSKHKGTEVSPTTAHRQLFR
jgi:hypothetical protein